MNKFIGSLIILLVLILTGCSRDSITSPQSNKTSGQVSLQFDKVNAPKNVVNITAYLTRTGYDTLKGTLNLLNDSSADIFIQNIPAGQWHLTVNALNDSNVVVYSGETDVTITDGFTTQVNLTLISTGQGFGNVYIIVNWANNQPIFIDYLANPVFTIVQNPSYPNSVSEAKILFENGIYKMWYLSGYNSARGNIWYAESNDGIHWNNKLNHPVLCPDSIGAWDNLTVGGGTVIKDDGIYKMYFNGVNSPFGQSQIGLAISTDGIVWSKYFYPVLKADSLQNFHLGTESVIKFNGTYYMYYQSSPINNYNSVVINLATSTDGLIWTNYNKNPILIPTLSWEGSGISYPSVINDEKQFLMIYQTMRRNAFGIAYSSDGINWTKKYQNPVFTKNDAIQNYIEINYPFLLKTGNEYRIYYTGAINSIQQCISFARSYNIQ